MSTPRENLAMIGLQVIGINNYWKFPRKMTERSGCGLIHTASCPKDVRLLKLQHQHQPPGRKIEIFRHQHPGIHHSRFDLRELSYIRIQFSQKVRQAKSAAHLCIFEISYNVEPGTLRP